MNQKNNEKMHTISLAEILGAFIGDGWIERSGKALYILGNKTEDKEYYDKALGPMFSEVFIPVKPKEFLSWKVYGIACYKRKIIRNCISLDFQPGLKSVNVQIPCAIINSNDDAIKAVLRGIFDTDGSFWCEKSRAKTSTTWKRTHHSHPELRITSCSKELLLQMNNLLKRFKINSNMRCLHKRGRKCNRNVNNAFALSVRRINHIRKWFKIIGSHNPKHLTKYAVWEKYGFLPPRTTISQRKEMLLGNINPETFYKTLIS